MLSFLLLILLVQAEAEEKVLIGDTTRFALLATLATLMSIAVLLFLFRNSKLVRSMFSCLKRKGGGYHQNGHNQSPRRSHHKSHHGDWKPPSPHFGKSPHHGKGHKKRDLSPSVFGAPNALSPTTRNISPSTRDLSPSSAPKKAGAYE